MATRESERSPTQEAIDELRALSAAQKITRNICPVSNEYVPTTPDQAAIVTVVYDEGDLKLKGRRVRGTVDDKLCPYAKRGLECPDSSTTCSFTHDVAPFLATKPPDIGVRCAVYDALGECPAGVACRFLSGHNADVERIGVEPGTVLNRVDGAFCQSMRKKTYKAQLVAEWSPNENPGGSSALAPAHALDAERDSGAQVVLVGGIEQGKRAEAPGSPRVVSATPPDSGRTIDWASKPVYIAPLTTIGNVPFRRILVEHGADVTCGEMALARHLLSGQRSEWSLIQRHSTETCFGVQLATNDAEEFASCAEVLSLHPDFAVDFIDLNCGCPIDQMFRKGIGSALMSRATRIFDLARSSAMHSRLPITVKLRMGVRVKDRQAHTLIQKIGPSDAPIAAVAVHGRTRTQRYTSQCDETYLRKCAEAALEAGIPFYANGDVYTWQDFERMMSLSDGVTGVMLARGAIIKPWLPQEIKERRTIDVPSSQRLEIIERFVHYGLEQWGSDTRGVETTRGFLLNWISFLHRYVPVGLLEVLPHEGEIAYNPALIHRRPFARMWGRNDIETLLLSSSVDDWVRITEMFLGVVPDGFRFVPKHKSNAWSAGR